MNKPLLHRLIRFKLYLLLTACSTAVYSLSTDKSQDIEIEANTANLDDTKNVSVYSGNVVVVQGSMRITGDKMTIYYTVANELEKIIMEGKPATFKQLPDNSTVYDEAEALIMEYYETTNLIVLEKSAKVKQGDRRLLADHVEYDTNLSQVRANSDEATPGASTSADTRVKLIIPGKKTVPEPAN